MSSIIGKQIKRFRKEKDMTQERLGQLIGVTTQAVSKWERGGMPDAELLPQLSQVLDVSIDALFGREQQSIAVTIARRLSHMPSEEAFRYAFSLCWAIEIGLAEEHYLVDDFMNSLVDNTVITQGNTDYFSKLMKDGGIANARLSTDFRHFFMMVEPKDSIRDQIAEPEKLRRVFEIFADPHILQIIFYLYSRLNTPIAASLISKETGLSVDEVERCMDVLCNNNLADRSIISTADGELSSYMFKQESSVIPLLCFADEIQKTDYRDFMISFDRTKPLL